MPPPGSTSACRRSSSASCTLSLRECPVCAERAASYHEQIRLMRRLPVLDASDATRRRVTAAAMSGRAETRSPMFILLAAALLVGLLLGADGRGRLTARRSRSGPVDRRGTRARRRSARRSRRRRARARRHSVGRGSCGRRLARQSRSTPSSRSWHRPPGPVPAGRRAGVDQVRAVSAARRPAVCDVRTRRRRRLRLVPRSCRSVGERLATGWHELPDGLGRERRSRRNAMGPAGGRRNAPGCRVDIEVLSR